MARLIVDLDPSPGIPVASIRVITPLNQGDVERLNKILSDAGLPYTLKIRDGGVFLADGSTGVELRIDNDRTLVTLKEMALLASEESGVLLYPEMTVGLQLQKAVGAVVSNVSPQANVLIITTSPVVVGSVEAFLGDVDTYINYNGSLYQVDRDAARRAGIDSITTVMANPELIGKLVEAGALRTVNINTILPGHVGLITV